MGEGRERDLGILSSRVILSLNLSRSLSLFLFFACFFFVCIIRLILHQYPLIVHLVLLRFAHKSKELN